MVYLVSFPDPQYGTVHALYWGPGNETMIDLTPSKIQESILSGPRWLQYMITSGMQIQSYRGGKAWGGGLMSGRQSAYKHTGGGACLCVQCTIHKLFHDQYRVHQITVLMLPCKRSSLQFLNCHFTRKGIDILCRVLPLICLSSFYQHTMKYLRSSPFLFAYCKHSNTGDDEGLGARKGHLTTSYQPIRF